MNKKESPAVDEIQNNHEIPTFSEIGEQLGSLICDLKQKKDFGQTDLKEIIYAFKRVGLNPNDFWRGYTDRQIEIESKQE